MVYRTGVGERIGVGSCIVSKHGPQLPAEIGISFRQPGHPLMPAEVTIDLSFPQ
jgi:hypothetical protein